MPLPRRAHRCRCIARDYDFDAHIELVPVKLGDVSVTYAATALEEDFDFIPHTSLREGLRAFARWYAEYYETSNVKLCTR